MDTFRPKIEITCTRVIVEQLGFYHTQSTLSNIDPVKRKCTLWNFQVFCGAHSTEETAIPTSFPLPLQLHVLWESDAKEKITIMRGWTMQAGNTSLQSRESKQWWNNAHKWSKQYVTEGIPNLSSAFLQSVHALVASVFHFLHVPVAQPTKAYEFAVKLMHKNIWAVFSIWKLKKK